MGDPFDPVTVEELEELRAQGRILFIRQVLAETPEVFERNLLLRGLSILGALRAPESQRLSAQRFRARLYNERTPESVIPPEGMVVFPLEDMGEQRYAIAIVPAEEE